MTGDTSPMFMRIFYKMAQLILKSRDQATLQKLLSTMRL